MNTKVIGLDLTNKWNSKVIKEIHVKSNFLQVTDVSKTKRVCSSYNIIE